MNGVVQDKVGLASFKDGDKEVTLAVLYEPGASSYFGVEPSFLEQVPEDISSPYGNGNLNFQDED